jgi:hypothetical protein
LADKDWAAFAVARFLGGTDATIELPFVVGDVNLDDGVDDDDTCSLLIVAMLDREESDVVGEVGEVDGCICVDKVCKEFNKVEMQL